MPCYKCSNGKYKYGERGRCQFDTLKACRAAEATIHAREKPQKDNKMSSENTKVNCLCNGCSGQDCNKHKLDSSIG